MGKTKTKGLFVPRIVAREYNVANPEDNELSRHTTIRFVLGAGSDDWVDVSIDSRGRLNVRGGYVIDIRPEAANAVSVGTKSWQTND